MTTQETITKLIEKYEGEIEKIEEKIGFARDSETLYYIGKFSAYQGFISDLKELQNTINN